MFYFFPPRLEVVESIPEDLYYSGNVTFGRPLEQVWKHLLSIATERVEVTSFYWTLTGEDINVNSSSDLSVSYPLKEIFFFKVLLTEN